MKPPSAHDIDALGHIKALIAELTEQEDALKHLLIDYHKSTGVADFHGDLFDATVSEFDKSTLDMDAVRAKLSAQFIRAHTSLTHIYRVGVVARKRS